MKDLTLLDWLLQLKDLLWRLILIKDLMLLDWLLQLKDLLWRLILIKDLTLLDWLIQLKDLLGMWRDHLALLCLLDTQHVRLQAGLAIS